MNLVTHNPSGEQPTHHSAMEDGSFEEFITSACGYHRVENDTAVISWPRGAPNGASTPSSLSSGRIAAGSGISKLPMEVTQLIVGSLDIRNLVRVRTVCKGLLAAVEDLPSYKSIMMRAGHVVRALHSTILDTDFFMYELEKIMSSNLCHLCKGYRNLLHLQLRKRVCSACLSSPSPPLELQMTTLEEAMGCFPALSPQILGALVRESFPSIAGTYGPSSSFMIGDIMLASHNILSVSAILRIRAETGVTTWSLPQTTQSLRRLSGVSSAFGVGVSMQTSVAINRLLRGYAGGPDHAACIPLPTFDPETKVAEHGVSCIGCNIEYELVSDELRDPATSTTRMIVANATVLERNRNRVYNPAAFPQHARRCGYAQRCLIEHLPT